MKGEEVDFSKTLFVAPLDSLKFKRFWIKSGYVYPVTVEVFGHNGDLFGLNIKAFDPVHPSVDTNGQFLVVLNSLQTGESVELKRRTTYRPEEYAKMFAILPLLDTKGFDIFFNRAMNWTATGSPAVQRVCLDRDFKPQISCLESYFGPNEVLL